MKGGATVTSAAELDVLSHQEIIFRKLGSISPPVWISGCSGPLEC